MNFYALASGSWVLWAINIRIEFYKSEKTFERASSQPDRIGLSSYQDLLCFASLSLSLKFFVVSFGEAMGRGKYKSKPTGHRQFSTPEEMRKPT